METVKPEDIKWTEAEVVAPINEEPKKQQEPPKEKRLPQTLAADERGLLVGGSLEEQYRLAKYYSQSGLMPAGLKTPEQILVALQLCRELGLPPMSSIGKICVINGTPSLFGDLPLALVMKSKLLESIKEETVMNGTELIAAVCTVKRVGMDAITREFTVADARTAGIWGKRVWAVYPKRMIQMRARSWALKDAFPDVLGGVSIAEYDNNVVVVDGEVVGSEQKPAKEIEQLYG